MGVSASILNTLEVVNLRDYKDESLLQAFYSDLYLPAFPISSQQENPEIWSENLWGTDIQDSQFQLNALIAGTQLSDPSKRQIYAGHLFEFHYPSNCGLLTYLVVDPKFRKQGLCRSLLDRALQILAETAKERNTELAAVFGEINDPRKIGEIEDSINPWERLYIFEKLGARIVDIPYVQPGLVRDENRSRCLLLVTFDHGKPESRFIRRSIVFDFLKGFYEILGIQHPEEDHDYVNMRSAFADADLPLITMRQEQPVLDITDYGVAFHFVNTIEPESGEDNLLKRSANWILSLIGRSKAKRTDPMDPERLNVFESFEQDIMSHSYKEIPPLRSAPMGETGGRIIHITFPNYMDYISEGQYWRLCCIDSDYEKRVRTLKALTCKTTFKSGVIVYHLVLTSDENSTNSTLNEYDLTKLVKLYTAGEGIDVSQLPRFSMDGEDLTWDQLVDTVFHDTPVYANTLQAITLELLTGESDDEPDWDSFYRCCASLAKDRREGTLEMNQHDEADDGVAKKLKALSGIVCGILDFNRIDAWELRDVLDPICADDLELTSFQKGILFSVVTTERIFEQNDCRLQIGISPYLILPQAVLLYNEEIIRRTVHLFPDQEERHINKLEIAKGKIEWELNENLLPNLFHYWTERMLYNRGFDERGLQVAMTRVERRLVELTARIEASARRRERHAGIIIQALAAILTAVFIRDIIYESLQDSPEWQLPTFGIFIGIIVLFFIYLYWRASRY